MPLAVGGFEPIFRGYIWPCFYAKKFEKFLEKGILATTTPTGTPRTIRELAHAPSHAQIGCVRNFE